MSYFKGVSPGLQLQLPQVAAQSANMFLLLQPKWWRGFAFHSVTLQPVSRMPNLPDCIISQQAKGSEGQQPERTAEH